MGMHTYVLGFAPPDEKYVRMLKARQACLDAGLEVPASIDEFFQGENPDPVGFSISLSGVKKYAKACRPWKEDSREGFEIVLDELPKNIKVIRFVNSW